MKLQHRDISRTVGSERSEEPKKNWFNRKVVPLVASLSAIAGFGTACTLSVDPNPQLRMESFDGGGIPRTADASGGQDGGTMGVDSDGGSSVDGGSCNPPRPLPCDVTTQIGSAPVSDFVAVPLSDSHTELTATTIAAISSVLSSDFFVLVTASDTEDALIDRHATTTPAGVVTQSEYLAASGQTVAADGTVVVAPGAKFAYVTVFEPALTLSQTSIADAPEIIWQGENRSVLYTPDYHIMAKTSAYGTVGLDQSVSDANFTVQVTNVLPNGHVVVEVTDSCGNSTNETVSPFSISTVSTTRGTSLNLYVGAVNTEDGSKSAELAIVTDFIPLSDESSVSIGRQSPGSGIVSLSTKVVSDTALASGDSVSVSGQSVEYTLSYNGVDVAPENKINVTMNYGTGSITLPIQGSGDQTFAGNAISLSTGESSIAISGVTSDSLVYLPGENKLFVRLASGNYSEATSSEAGQFFATVGTANVVFTIEEGSFYVVFQEQSGSLAGDPRFGEAGRLSYLVVAGDGTSFQYTAAYDTGAITSNPAPTVVSVGYTTPNCSTLTGFTPETVVFSVTNGVCHATFEVAVNVCGPTLD